MLGINEDADNRGGVATATSELYNSHEMAIATTVCFALKIINDRVRDSVAREGPSFKLPMLNIILYNNRGI